MYQIKMVTWLKSYSLYRHNWDKTQSYYNSYRNVRER